MTSENGMTHLNAAGEANMVDVSAKQPSSRVAVAQAVLKMLPETMIAIENQQIKKGEVLAVARVAGIQGAKRCSDLIPLCHPLPLTKVSIEFNKLDDCRLQVYTLCKVEGKTGVEMEALTAASVAALTIYDMCKAIDKGMSITECCLLEKTGGKSGTFIRRESQLADGG